MCMCDSMCLIVSICWNLTSELYWVIICNLLEILEFMSMFDFMCQLGVYFLEFDCGILISRVLVFFN